MKMLSTSLDGNVPAGIRKGYNTQDGYVPASTDETLGGYAPVVIDVK